MSITNAPTTSTDLNEVRIAGTLLTMANRQLPGSARLPGSVQLVLGVEAHGHTFSVVINDPQSFDYALVPGVHVTVAGHLATRFFRLAGATQSRTEVIADDVMVSAS